MSKITISEPEGPYSATLDTQVMEVTIKEAFTGVIFVTENGEELCVIMRDGGFELRYTGPTFNRVWLELKNGEIKS